MPPHFTIDDIPNLAGKVILVTGATAGVGFETALAVAGKGAHTFVLGRSQARVQSSIAEIKKVHPNANVEGDLIDVASLRSVKAFSDRFHARNLPIHVLVNNAGIGAAARSLTADGIEAVWHTNHVGGWYLTNLLMDIIKASRPSRIVFVASVGHRYTKDIPLSIDEVNLYNGGEFGRYAQSKLANILTAKKITTQLAGEGIDDIYVNAIHPGYVKTEIFQKSVSASVFTSALVSMVTTVTSFMALTPKDGALTQLYAATSPEIVEKDMKGLYFEDIARLKTPSALAQDADLAEKLWKFTEELVESKLAAKDAVDAVDAVDVVNTEDKQGA